MGGNFDVVGGKGIENEELQGRAGSANILCGTKSRQLKSSDLNLCHVQAHGISANITSEPETCIELGAGREKGRERAERDAGTEGGTSGIDGGWRMEDGGWIGRRGGNGTRSRGARKALLVKRQRGRQSPFCTCWRENLAPVKGHQKG
jgi:hypothetical protein